GTAVNGQGVSPKILPGFMMPFGSTACLMRRITSRAGPCSRALDGARGHTAAVLAGGGAAHPEGELVDLVGDEEDAADLVWVAAVDQVARMEAATADVAVGGDRDLVPLADVLDRSKRLGDAGDGHAEV